MKTANLKRFSILGLVLLTVSAVTAAVLPSKSNKGNANLQQNGGLTFSTIDGDQQTCQPTIAGHENCFNTDSDGDFSSTTGDFRLSDTNDTTGNDEAED